MARGTESEYTIDVSGLDSTKSYTLHAIASEGISFSSTCDYDSFSTGFTMDKTISGETTFSQGYTMHACAAPSGSLMAWLEVDRMAVAYADFICCYTFVENPTVRFGSSRYSVDEGSSASIGVSLSYESFHRILVPIRIARGTAETGDYSVPGLTDGFVTVTLDDLATSQSFTVTSNQDDDAFDEMVNFGFPPLSPSIPPPDDGMVYLPSWWLSGTIFPSSATLTIDDDEPTPPNRPPVVEDSIPNQTLTVGDSTITIGLSDKFTEPDGGSLLYSVNPTSSIVATVTPNSIAGILTVTPLAVGSETFTVRAADVQGLYAEQGFLVTVDAAEPVMEDPVIVIAALDGRDGHLLEYGSMQNDNLERHAVFRVTASNLDNATEYTIKVSTDNSIAKITDKLDPSYEITGACPSDADTFDAVDFVNKTEHSIALNLEPCDPANPVTITATLLEGTLTLTSAQQRVIIFPDVAPPTIFKSPTDGVVISMTYSLPTISFFYEAQLFKDDDPDPDNTDLLLDLTPTTPKTADHFSPTEQGEYKVGIQACERYEQGQFFNCWEFDETSNVLSKLAAPTNLELAPLPLQRAQLTWNGDANATKYVVEFRAAGRESEARTPEAELELDLNEILELQSTGTFFGLGDAPYAYQLNVKALGAPGDLYLNSTISEEITTQDSPLLKAGGQAYGSSIGSVPVSGKAILKWREIPEAQGRYQVRYRELRSFQASDGNRYHHSSDNVDIDDGAGWRLSDSGYDTWQTRNVTLVPSTQGIEGATIIGLKPRELYAIQVNFITGLGTTQRQVYSARDVFVWPFRGRPGTESTSSNQGGRIATYPVYGHFPNRTFTYRICDARFPTAMSTALVSDWKNTISGAFSVWQEATGGNVTVRYDSSDCPNHWDVDLSPWETILLGWDSIGLAAMQLIQSRIQESDDEVSEVWMVDPPGDIEMITGVFKLCVLGASACAVSPQYADEGNGNTEIVSADVLLNWDRMGPRTPTTPTTTIEFNKCPAMGDYHAYRTLMHEAGHALGLSGADIGDTAVKVLNDFRAAIHDAIGLYSHLVPITGDIAATINGIIQNTIGELPESTYEASHPSIADSVMNYDARISDMYLIASNDTLATRVRNEPDCWPHPFDIMAINSLYQAEYP